MNIYALRDRLIGYYLHPFAGASDKEVLAAVATNVNGRNSDISQAPHHFEIWKLGRVDEEGHIHQERELLAGCDSLVRGDLRKTGEPGSRPVAPAAPPSRRDPRDAPAHARAGSEAPTHQAPAEDGPVEEVRGRFGGTDPKGA